MFPVFRAQFTNQYQYGHSVLEIYPHGKDIGLFLIALKIDVHYKQKLRIQTCGDVSDWNFVFISSRACQRSRLVGWKSVPSLHINYQNTCDYCF
jgi:hypothetical protein